MDQMRVSTGSQGLLPASVIDVVVAFLPPHMIAGARVACRDMEARIKSIWMTIEGVRKVFGCMMEPHFRNLDTPPIAWLSGGRACDKRLQARFFTYGDQIVPFHQLTGSLLLSLQKCWEVNTSTPVTAVSFAPQPMMSSPADVEDYFNSVFTEDEEPPADYPDEAIALWRTLRWVLRGLIDKYTFTRFYAERTAKGDHVECQLMAWLWEPKFSACQL